MVVQMAVAQEVQVLRRRRSSMQVDSRHRHADLYPTWVVIAIPVEDDGVPVPFQEVVGGKHKHQQLPVAVGLMMDPMYHTEVPHPHPHPSPTLPPPPSASFCVPSLIQ
jgi:hypothetical protein